MIHALAKRSEHLALTLGFLSLPSVAEFSCSGCISRYREKHNEVYIDIVFQGPESPVLGEEDVPVACNHSERRFTYNLGRFGSCKGSIVAFTSTDLKQLTVVPHYNGQSGAPFLARSSTLRVCRFRQSV